MTSKLPPTDDHESSKFEGSSAIREFASMAIVVGMLSALGYGFIRDQLAMHHGETPLIVDVRTTSPEQEALCGPNTRDGRPTPITMLYSDDKKRWIEDVAQTFSRLCPNIQVKLDPMDDVSSADAIVAGSAKPTLWAPADDLVVHYLDARWKKERPNDTPLFHSDERTPIAASPLVTLIWRDRAQVVDRVFQNRPPQIGPWVELGCAQVPTDASLDGVVLSDMVPGTWIDWYNPLVLPPPNPAQVKKAREKVDLEVEDPRAVYRAPFPSLDKIRSWGRVKFLHTSPTRSAAGLEAMYLMAYDYAFPTSQRPEEVKMLKASVLADPTKRGQVVSLDMLKGEFAKRLADERARFLKFVRRCEAGLDPASNSPRQLSDAFFRVGSSRYDAVITYEHLVFDILDQVDGHGGAIASMEVLYPPPTIMNQHPVLTLDTAHLSAEEKRAAEKWVAYLGSESAQKKAIDFGFRPANSSVSIREYDSEENPFLKYRRYGIDFESPIFEPPRLESDAIADLVRIWQDATGRN